MKRFLTLFLLSFPVLAFGQRQGQQLVDSLLKELPGAKEDTNKVKLLYALAYVFQNINATEGVKYGETELALSEKLAWKKGMGLANNSLGINYDAKADYAKSLEYHRAALKINEQIGEKREIARSLGNIAFTYQDQSDHVNALDYNFKALKIFEEIGDKEGEAATTGAIGSVYQSENEYDKALDYQQKALQLHRALLNKSGMAGNMGNLGIVYGQQHNYPQALVYDVMALEIYRDLGDKSGEERNLGNIGNIYTNLKDYTKALDYDVKALKIAEELNDKNIIATNYGNIGEVYLSIVKDTGRNIMRENSGATFKATNLQKAIDNLNKGVSVSTEIGLWDAVIEFRQYLSEAYSISGNNKEAFENYKLYTALKDSLFSSTNKAKITQMGNKYEGELKARDAQIAQLTATNASHEHIFLIVGSILAVIAIGIIVRKGKPKSVPS